MVVSNCFGSVSALSANYQAIIITAILVASMFGYKHFKKKKLSPVLLIVLSAVAGMVIYGIQFLHSSHELRCGCLFFCSVFLKRACPAISLFFEKSVIPMVLRRSTDFCAEVSSIIDSFSRFVDGMKEINGSLDSIMEAMENTA